MHQDLVREQRRRYDVEAERDLAITQRDLAEEAIDRVVGDLQQYQTNAQNQVNRMIGNIGRKQTRIGVLVQEKFALQLLYKQNAHHLQRSRGDIGLLEYNRDRLYERYEKWKNKIHDMRQNILILQEQILVLQNNPPNQINMALPGLQMPELCSFEQDHEKYVDDFIAYINYGGINDEIRIRNILDRSVKGEVREWYHREFDNKNWELQNVLDNSAIGANITAIRGANAGL